MGNVLVDVRAYVVPFSCQDTDPCLDILLCSTIQLYLDPSFILYMLYFPEHLKFEATEVPVGRNGKPRVRSKLWGISIALANVTVAHL